jgi:hypothetical protein
MYPGYLDTTDDILTMLPHRQGRPSRKKYLAKQWKSDDEKQPVWCPQEKDIAEKNSVA